MIPIVQRYWDEHNIVRPDYAKTLAEVREEQLKKQMEEQKGGLWGQAWRKFLVSFIVLRLLLNVFGGTVKLGNQ